MLRIVNKKDVDGMIEWMNDPEIMKSFQFQSNDISENKVIEFVEKAIIDAKQGREFHFAVVDEEDNYLGTISLKNVNKESKNAEFAICLRKVAQGKGFAKKATLDILQYAFEDLQLARVYLNVFSDNLRAIHLYEKIGFHYEGEWRRHLYVHDDFKSLKWYGMLREEYIRKYGEIING